MILNSINKCYQKEFENYGTSGYSSRIRAKLKRTGNA